MARLTTEERGKCEPASHHFQIMGQPFKIEGIVDGVGVLALCVKCGNTAELLLSEDKPSMPTGSPFSAR